MPARSSRSSQICVRSGSARPFATRSCWPFWSRSACFATPENKARFSRRSTVPAIGFARRVPAIWGPRWRSIWPSGPCWRVSLRKTGGWGPGKAIVPLEVLAAKSPRHRDAVYAVLAGVLAGLDITGPLSPFVLQLSAGAIVNDAADRTPPDKRATDPRLRSLIGILEHVAASQPADLSAAQVGELTFLRGRALYLAGRHLDAAGALADLVEKWPQNDRADAALRQAVSIAQELLAADGVDRAKARAVFVRAGRLFRKWMPDAPASKRLQYFIAEALENEGRLHEAAGEYAVVPHDDPNAARAALRRSRCLRTLLQSAIDEGKRSQAEIASLTDEAVRAAREGVAGAASRPAGTTEADTCLAAEQVLVLADLLNSATAGRFTESVQVLDGFELRFARCPSAIGQALRERIIALRQLKRMGEARRVVEQYLKTEPEQAGPVMIRLLEAMHSEIESAADRGDQKRVGEVAGEAVELARSIMEWSDARPNRLPPRDRLTIGVWQASGTLYAGRPAEAVRLYDACVQAAAGVPGDHKLQDVEIRLGRAEALLAEGKAADALTVFAQLTRELPEESSLWWRAFAGQLQCHTAVGHDAAGLLQAISQRRYFAPDLGGPRIRRTIETVEKTNRSRVPNSAPTP